MMNVGGSQGGSPTARAQAEDEERLRLTDEGLAGLRELAGDEAIHVEQRVMLLLAVDELQLRRRAAGRCR